MERCAKHRVEVDQPCGFNCIYRRLFNRDVRGRDYRNYRGIFSQQLLLETAWAAFAEDQDVVDMMRKGLQTHYQAWLLRPRLGLYHYLQPLEVDFLEALEDEQNGGGENDEINDAGGEVLGENGDAGGEVNGDAGGEVNGDAAGEVNGMEMENGDAGGEGLGENGDAGGEGLGENGDAGNMEDSSEEEDGGGH